MNTPAFTSRSTCLRACAAAVLAATGGLAMAQSSVQVYGILDAGVQMTKTGVAGASWDKSVAPGNQWASRLGFQGREDLGGGLQAVFNIETGIANDTGETIVYGNGASSFWARRSVVGLKGNFGEILLGRDYTPGFWSVIQLDRNGYGLPGTISTASQIQDARANNGIFYNTPKFGNVMGRFAVAAGENVTGRLVAGSVDYRDAALYLTASVQRRNTITVGTTPAGHNKEGGLGAGYKFGNVVTNIGYWAVDLQAVNTGALDKTKAVWVGAGVTFGPHVVYGQVAQTKFDRIGASAQGKAVNYGIAYNYFLSKTTNLYAGYGGTNNDANSNMALQTGSVRIGGTVLDADPKAFVAGIKQAF